MDQTIGSYFIVPMLKKAIIIDCQLQFYCIRFVEGKNYGRSCRPAGGSFSEPKQVLWIIASKTKHFSQMPTRVSLFSPSASCRLCPLG